MKTNRRASVAHAVAVSEAPRTYGGGFGAIEKTTSRQLLRQVATCLLWEDTFYEKGSTIAEEIAESCAKADPQDIANIAVLTRTDLKLRHVPLFLLSHLDKRRAEVPGLVASTLPKVIQRADELAEFLAIHAKVTETKPSNLKGILSAQVKKGIAKAFRSFNAYELAKYNRDTEVRLRDVAFLCHVRPKDMEQGRVLAKLVNKSYYPKRAKSSKFPLSSYRLGEFEALETPDTWEVALSSGKDKKETFERLISDGKLGDMAFLRNLRNMIGAKVDRKMLRESLSVRRFEKVLPFRFISAAKYAPELEAEIDAAMLRSASTLEILPGRTLLIVDISGSMGGALSGKSELRRVEAACALAMLVREVCEDVAIYATAGDDYGQRHMTDRVPNRRGKALADAIVGLNAKLGTGGIFLTQVMAYIAEKEEPFDRVLVITDEQDCDHNSNRSPARAKKLGQYNYIMNVAPYGVGLAVKDGWTRINGFSERVLDFVRFEESEALN